MICARRPVECNQFRAADLAQFPFEPGNRMGCAVGGHGLNRAEDTDENASNAHVRCGGTVKDESGMRGVFGVKPYACQRTKNSLKRGLVIHDDSGNFAISGVRRATHNSDVTVNNPDPLHTIPLNTQREQIGPPQQGTRQRESGFDILKSFRWVAGCDAA